MLLKLNEVKEFKVVLNLVLVLFHFGDCVRCTLESHLVSYIFIFCFNICAIVYLLLLFMLLIWFVFVLVFMGFRDF